MEGNYGQFRVNLLHFFLADPALTALIGEQMYFQQLATVALPLYPCVTVQTRRGSQHVSLYQEFPLILGAHSQVSQEEALGILTVLSNRVRDGDQTGTGFVLRHDGTPTGTYNAASRLQHFFLRTLCTRLGV